MGLGVQVEPWVEKLLHELKYNMPLMIAELVGKRLTSYSVAMRIS